ncbi:glycosyltransferase family 4 protein [Elioraea thermophila]|uniref:glycosyltransferase family 4 protein n=1 Tax=Elioraea thermophila TaxID=2185104 RepID=UPI000DF1C36D|nr:glycosyltransferase family 4 protein [Elioraea thermophila]
MSIAAGADLSVALIVPGPIDTVSGGYGYDRRILRGLAEIGHRVRAVELAGRHPLPDETAEAAAWQAIADLGAEEIAVIDGLCLPSFGAAAEAIAARTTVGLIHHPTPLEKGLSEAEAALLREKEARLLPLLSRVIATSRATADRLGEMGIARERIGIVEPGTDPAPRAEGSGSDACAILSIGACVPRKGHDLLLRALARLFDLDWHLTIVGSLTRDPVHARGLAALAEELAIAQRVTFAGEIDESSLEALWRRTDVFALATWFEGYGMAVAEALARGIPCAITAGGAVADLVPPEAGVVVPAGDWQALSRAMRRLIFDTELRRRMSDAAYATGQRLPRWEDQARRFADELRAAHAER